MGGAGIDRLFGDRGDDFLQGDGGNDILTGGSGSDKLVGGEGADLFILDTAADGATRDSFVDYTADQGDKIVLNKSVFQSLNGAVGDTLNINDFALVSDDQAIDRTGAKIIYNSTNGQLFYDADRAGGANALQFAVLNNKATLSADSFSIG
jgi:Ca2+-binding RTX toxin-like protein